MRNISCVLAVMLTASAVLAQTTGTITGTVTDATKAVAPNVKVTALSRTSGERRETTTNNTGQYTFPFLPPGDYELEFSLPGFTTVVERATLSVTERIGVDATLKPSAVSERVEVSSSGPLLQTESAAQGRVVDGKTLKDLPLATRNFTQLLSLTAGTSSALNNSGALGRGTQIISSGGARTTSNAIQIDGVDSVNIHTNSASDNGVGSTGILVPSPEAVQEFKVQTTLYDTQSGRSGGANIALCTKSRSNQVHASLFEFLRNTDLNANTFFFNATATPRPTLNQNQYVQTLRAPLHRDKPLSLFSFHATH